MSTTVEDLRSRFHEICDTTKNQLKITVVGAGSIGSNLVTLLARLGIDDITVYDDDLVESHNLGHQAFSIHQIGDNKVDALFDNVVANTGIRITAFGEKTDGRDIDTDILILGTDSMSSRKQIVENANFTFCIDGRMGGETFNIYTFSSMDREAYEKTLYSDEQASSLPCGGKSIGYISYLVAGLMENQVKKILNGESFPAEINFCSKNLIMEVSKF